MTYAGRWFKFHHAMLDDPFIQRLPPEEFRRRFMAAVNGQENEFSAFLVPFDGRAYPEEWRALREAVFRRDGFRCVYCGAHGARLECDHVHPLALGGSNDVSNLVTACFRCNRSKGSKPLANCQKLLDGRYAFARNGGPR